MEGLRTIWFCMLVLPWCPTGATSVPGVLGDHVSFFSPGVIWVPQPSSPRALKEIPDTSHSAFFPGSPRRKFRH